jgi:hypothetical protein
MDYQTFQTSVHIAAGDKSISDYFVTNGIDFQQFLTRYIQIDKLLSKTVDPNESSFTQQIQHIQNCIEKQSHVISALTSQLHTSLDNFTNTEFKAVVSDYFQQLQTQIQNQTNPNTIKDALENFQHKLHNINSEKLNDIDRRNLSMLSNFQSNLLKDISTTLDSHTMHHKITSINDTLTQLHNNFTGNSSQKGKMTENVLYQNLVQAFPDCDVILTRDQSDSCDVQLKRDGKPTILIDSKHCEASNVRKSDLEKFYEDCQVNDACGILCNTFGGIANRKHFEIDVKDKRVFVFLSNHQFDPVLFQVATRIIYNVYEIIKDQRTDIIQIDQQLYQRLKIEYNFFLQSFQQHLDNIKQNVNALSQLTLSQIDHFFKRTTLTTDQSKPFACHMCGTGCASTKALKKHLKDKHDFVMAGARTRGRPKNDAGNEEEMSE